MQGAMTTVPISVVLLASNNERKAAILRRRADEAHRYKGISCLGVSSKRNGR